MNLEEFKAHSAQRKAMIKGIRTMASLNFHKLKRAGYKYIEGWSQGWWITPTGEEMSFYEALEHFRRTEV